APLDEAGDPTEKFAAFREVIAKYAAVPSEPVSDRAPKLALPAVELNESSSCAPHPGRLPHPYVRRPRHPAVLTLALFLAPLLGLRAAPRRSGLRLVVPGPLPTH
ncbi:hypothetical protein ACFYWY_37040, partial [Streptomyces sp. NPDC002870]